MKTLLLSLLITFSAQAARTIHVSGVITNSADFKPLAGARVFDEANNSLAVTDDKGFFTTTLSIPQDGEIDFKFRLKAKGFQDYTVVEKWGDLEDEINASYYIGLQQDHVPPFSELFIDKRINSPEMLTKNISEVKEKIQLDRAIQALKVGNNQVFFETPNGYYLVNEGGYLRLSSSEALVSIDKQRPIPANELNTRLQRSQVKGMSTVKDAKAEFIIYTKE